MNIILESLELSFFKGVVSEKILFNPFVNDISAPNGGFKTTTVDAWNWLLFGKDSEGRADFDIKTLRSDNSVIERVDHSVCGVLNVSGQRYELKRVLREQWVKRKGVEKFDRNFTECFVDDVPVNVSEFQAAINKIINEEVLKLITNPLYFAKLHWQSRRKILCGMAGEINFSELIPLIISTENKIFVDLLAYGLMQGKTLSELKAKNKASKNRITDRLVELDNSLKEQNNTMSEALDWKALEADKGQIGKESDKLDEAATSSQSALNAANQIVTQTNNKITQLRASQRTIMTDAINKEQLRVDMLNEDYKGLGNQITAEKSRLVSLEKVKDSAKQTTDSDQKQLDTHKQKIAGLLESWHKANNEVFSESDCLICPLYSVKCNDTEAVDKFNTSHLSALEAFETDKRARLEKINADGKAEGILRDAAFKLFDEHGKVSIDLCISVVALGESIEEMKKRYDSFKVVPVQQIVGVNILEWSELEKQIDTITIPEEQKADETISQRRKDINERLIAVSGKLAVRDDIARRQARIVQIEDEQQTNISELSKIEGMEDAMATFQKANMNEMESRINHRFALVRFRLFDRLVNGEEEESCDILINGVPYESANKASRVNAGIDIINAISGFYSTYAPIFIDNRESVTDIIPTQSQIINLRVAVNN